MNLPTAPLDRQDGPPCAPGDVIHDKYRIEELLGSGGMAWVFRATHVELQQRVALKVLRVDPSNDNTEALARFRREARAAARVSGEATARVMDVGVLDEGSPFLVMECLDGRSLDRVVHWGTRMPVTLAVDYVIQACEGLAETHAAGIIHRDLKPSNLFLTQRSDGSVRLKLIDFGVSKFAEPSNDVSRVTSANELVGSPVYMAPEQMRIGRRVDCRADIWSMGVILYELLAQGRLPFEGPTLPEICARVLDEKPPQLASVRPDIPRALEAIVLRCLEKDPARRFQTVSQLADALVRFGPHDARARADRIRRILAKQGAPLLRLPPPRRRSLVPRAAQVGGILAVSTALAVSVILGLCPTDARTARGSQRSILGLAVPAAKPAPAPANSVVTLEPEVFVVPDGGVAPSAKGWREPALSRRSLAVSAAALRSKTTDPAATFLATPRDAPKDAEPLVAPPPSSPPTVSSARPRSLRVAEFGGRE